MFEAAELGRKLSKAEYGSIVPELRTALLKVQTRLDNADFSVVVLLNGLAGSGIVDTANVLSEWLDARYLHTEAYAEPTEDERARPEFWRYWMWLPAAGRIGVFLGNWYQKPIVDRAAGRSNQAEFGRELQRIANFERTLADNGTLLVKLWLHVSKAEQKKRIRELEAARATRWRVGKDELEQQRRYPAFRRVSEVAIRETSTAVAPWTVIEAGDERFRDVFAAREILSQLQARVDNPACESARAPRSPIPDPSTILDTLDLAARIDRREYDEKMPRLQGRLNALARKLARRHKSAIIAFEGPDAAGKGGAIRRLTWALDVRQYRVIPIAAPTEEERAHHYLWRFWRHLPRRGKITIYDRSWYGRVLVERVERFASDEAWLRAYKEINEFEQELVEGGVVLVKFWIHISSEEQLRRFEARELEPWKQHKISAEDYRNRAKANLYEVAASEMIARCSTEYAPFALIAGDDKHLARLKVLETVCERLEEAL